MSLTVNAKTFTLDTYPSSNAAAYVGPAHTLTVKDDLRISRVAAKPTTVFSGVVRWAAKLSRTHTLTGALSTTGDSITEISHSIPVGASTADIDAICADLGAFIASAAYKTMVKSQVISG
jgi:hypothetical protein